MGGQREVEMNRWRLSLWFSVTVAVLPNSSAGQEFNYEQYEATRNLSTQLFIAVFVKFSSRLQTTAILQACDRAGIAYSVDVTAKEGTDFIFAEMERLRKSNSKTKLTLATLTGKERFTVVTSVSDQLIVYKLGYKDAVGLLKDRVPEVCEAGMKGADKILKERK
jgi:hypothetical protein